MKTSSPILPTASARGLWLTAIAIALAFGASASFCWGGPSNQTDPAGAPASVPWRDNQVIKPESLVKSLSAATDEKPLVICVGFPVLYHTGHVVGAKFAGPAAKPEGIRALKRLVSDLPRNKQIVLYCGCCPWKHCPNIRPAFRAMQALGFTNVKVLSIPDNFQKDWIAKGFPIEKGADKQ